MKRLQLWLRELTLSQQLLTLICIVLSTFAVFLFVFLSPRIDTFASQEMFRMLHNSQESLVYYFDEYPNSIPQMTQEQDTSILQELYDLDHDTFLLVGEQGFGTSLENNVRKNIVPNYDGIQDVLTTYKDEETGSTVTVQYSITQLKDGRYLISMTTDTYRAIFRNSLVNGVVNLNVLVVGMLFVLLMIWVASLIHPLNQIKNYITKIKSDDNPPELNVNRRDEIGEVAVALQDMEEELQKQSKVKEEMIQNISHDLKTPIATIKSYAESIKDGIYPYETLEKSCDVIIEHADRLEKKVHSLIVLNKMGYLLDSCEPGDALDMNAVIEKAILSLKVIRPEITFIRNLDANVKFHGEEEPWRIVIENLLDNALRYAKTWIRVDCSPNDLKVTNDGKQISEDRLGKLFRPYEKGTDGKFGLGLSIVYRVATTYGYKVEAENLQEGVCFHIWKDVSKKEAKARIREIKKETKEKEKELKELENKEKEKKKQKK